MVQIILTGDVNLMNVTDARVPFRRVKETLRAADVVFSNLECCLAARSNVGAHNVEGFFADPAVAGAALKDGCIAAVGLANNVNYGAEAITELIANLDRLGVAHTGAGVSDAAARAPAVIERKATKIAFLQRSSVFWATNHEATSGSPGIAIIPGHTAYQVPMYKEAGKGKRPPLNRPGIPPHIVTWADRAYLKRFEQDVASVRGAADLVIASFHWGWNKDIFDYMRDIGHCAIDAGADAVVGHGAHNTTGIEIYKSKPIFYGLGSLSFHTGHGGEAHGNWIGMIAKLDFKGRKLDRTTFSFVRHNEGNETFVCNLADEEAELADIERRSRPLGVRLTTAHNEVLVSAG